MASFSDMLQRRERKRKCNQEMTNAFSTIKGCSFTSCREMISSLQANDIEGFLMLKMTRSGLDTWRDFVCNVPKTALQLMLPVLRKILSLLCETDVSNDEATDCYALTKGLARPSNNDAIRKTLSAGMEVDHPAVTVISPPIESCLVCSSKLTVHNKPSRATIFDVDGPIPAMKVTLKCKHCKPNVMYGYAKFGNKNTGYKYFKSGREFVEASNETYFSRKLCSFQVNLALHSQVSFEGFCEAYNDTIEGNLSREIVAESNKMLEGKSSAQYLHKADRRLISKAFYNSEIEAEIVEREMLWTFPGTHDDDLDGFMDEVETLRSNELYQHKYCTENCKKRGCEDFTAMDGVWKLRFPHCMWPVSSKATNFPGLKLPDICVNEPASQNEAFCVTHSTLATEKDVPTGLRDFLKSCGVKKDSNDKCTSARSFAEVEQVNNALDRLPRDENNQTQVEGSQGLTEVLDLARSLGEQVQAMGEDTQANALDVCNKDTGDIQKVLRKWSRGLLHFVRGGGHIESWSPLYGSESPSQVFLKTIQYLYTRLKDKDPSEWWQFNICYDNMCNLCRLKIAVKPIPLPEPFDEIWLKVSKFIDDLHLRNHKRPECRQNYSTERIREKIEALNTPVCEQTFVWSSKFKKIMCAMPKRRFLFYYHRMVTKRNRYTEKCYRENRKPLLPGIKMTKKE